ncbi:hypothetical protein L7F22_042916 [Adiantum nelumboides]|nr:hypothetical protein [Adiantum nelumboides]
MGEGLWKEWITVMNEIEQKKTVEEFRTAVREFKAGMLAWKCHMQVLVKHVNALLHLHIAASKIPKKQIENLASNEDTYREIREILLKPESRLTSLNLQPTASHCHKLARARVTKGKKTMYYPQTKEWLPMTPYEQQVLVKEPEGSGATADWALRPVDCKRFLMRAIHIWHFLHASPSEKGKDLQNQSVVNPVQETRVVKRPFCSKN